MPAPATETPTSYQYQPTWKITPSSIVGYYQYVGERRINRYSNFTGIGNGTKIEAYKGEITSHSSRRLKNALELLFTLSKVKRVKSLKSGKIFKFRISLITLTLSAPQENYTDRQIKSLMLAPFLRHFKRKGLHNFVWKAERQKNGNIHFHILSDSYIDKTDIRNYWNRIQAQFGFIDKFEAKYGHRDPNSTDVKAVTTQKGMVNYMLKYMLKPVNKEDNESSGEALSDAMKGKVWDCSLNLKLKGDLTKPAEDWEFELMEARCKRGLFVKKEAEFCTMYFPRKMKIWDSAPSELSALLVTYLRKVRAFGSLEEWEKRHAKRTALAGIYKGKALAES